MSTTENVIFENEQAPPTRKETNFLKVYFTTFTVTRKPILE